MVARNSFEELLRLNDLAMQAAVKVDPLTPPAVDLVERYRDAPKLVESMFDGATELEELTPIALHKLREILEHPSDFDQVRMVQAQLSAATTVVNLQVKVDEGRLKRRKVDILPKIIEMMAQERKLLEATAIELVAD